MKIDSPEGQEHQRENAERQNAKVAKPELEKAVIVLQPARSKMDDVRHRSAPGEQARDQREKDRCWKEGGREEFGDVDVRLTASDGYSAIRSYSIASAPNAEKRVELTVERLPNGEVSPYLTQELAVGDRLELRGPIGGWFVWRTQQTEPIQLIAGGSGIVPLMAMIRSRASTGSTAPFRLLYSVREPGAVFYRDDLLALSDCYNKVSLTYAYTRIPPKDWPRPPGRIDGALIADVTWPSNLAPTCYVCGPTPFVESAVGFLSASGNSADKIRTERFGPTGDRK